MHLLRPDIGAQSADEQARVKARAANERDGGSTRAAALMGSMPFAPRNARSGACGHTPRAEQPPKPRRTRTFGAKKPRLHCSAAHARLRVRVRKVSLPVALQRRFCYGWQRSRARQHGVQLAARARERSVFPAAQRWGRTRSQGGGKENKCARAPTAGRAGAAVTHLAAGRGASDTRRGCRAGGAECREVPQNASREVLQHRCLPRCRAGSEEDPLKNSRGSEKRRSHASGPPALEHFALRCSAYTANSHGSKPKRASVRAWPTGTVLARGHRSLAPKGAACEPASNA